MITFADSLKLTSGLQFPVGVNLSGEFVFDDLGNISHLLVSGATGTGKSVFLNSMLLSLLFHNSPDKLRLILFDSKMVELGRYSGIPHLLIPVVTDPAKAYGVLMWLAAETRKRLRTFSEAGQKSLCTYNNHVWQSFSDAPELPQILYVVDDLTALLEARPESADVINEIIANGRTVGVHLIAATQTPMWRTTKKVSTLFRSKMVLSATTEAESKFLLNKAGAENLGAYGEALFSSRGAVPTKVHTIASKDSEFESIVSPLQQASSAYDEAALLEIERHIRGPYAAESLSKNEDDELLPIAIDIVLEMGQASVSMLQRQLKLGYGRAARLVDQMEQKGVVGPFEGSKPRQILITKNQWQKMQPSDGKNDAPLSEAQGPPEQHEIESERYTPSSGECKKKNGLLSKLLGW